MEFAAIITLLTIDVLLNILYRIWDSQKPKPMTFLEFYNFMYDERQEIIKILEEQNEETRKAMFNNYLNTIDRLNRKDNEKS